MLLRSPMLAILMALPACADKGVVDGAGLEDTGPALPCEGRGMPTWYQDADGDFYGDEGTAQEACEPPLELSAPINTGGDCDDADSDVHPGATERCDDIDSDCDGIFEEGAGLPQSFEDLDGDGYGDPERSSCLSPEDGWAALSGDCDSTDPLIHPEASERCNGVDDDCDGDIDEDPGADWAWYRDVDEDGDGNPSISVESCDQPEGYVATGTDCNDGSANISGIRDECYDFVDNDCDGLVDEDVSGAPVYWYKDADKDGYGDRDRVVAFCEAPSSYVSDSSDCDDGDSAINPAATEVCDGVDNDCNAEVDDDDPGLSIATATTYYVDEDEDGYGSAVVSSIRCQSIDPKESTTSGDCDDGAADTYPGASETCGDGRVNDCSGTAGRAEAACAFQGESVVGESTPQLSNGSCAPGSGLALAGDQDGDGADDLAVGSSACTMVWILSGTHDGVAALGDVGSGPIRASTNRGSFGSTLAGAVDLNGDGFDDLAVADPTDPGGGGGSAWIFYGPITASLSSDQAQASLTGSHAADFLGWSMALDPDPGPGGAGLWVGAWGWTPGTGTGAGSVWLVLGSASGSQSEEDAALQITGASGNGQLGRGLALGDLNGDGLQDLLVGAPIEAGTVADSGVVYILLGPHTTGGDVGALATASWEGAAIGEWAGELLASGGDSNGDGLDDVLVAVGNHNGLGSMVYLLQGPATAGSLSSLSGAAGTFTEGATGDRVGSSLAFVGDLDGDGLDDFGIGAEGVDVSSTDDGALYLLFGPSTAVVDLGIHPNKVLGSDGLGLGGTLAAMGDPEGDGSPKIAVGAPASTGRLYLLSATDY